MTDIYFVQCTRGLTEQRWRHRRANAHRPDDAVFPNPLPTSSWVAWRVADMETIGPSFDGWRLQEVMPAPFLTLAEANNALHGIRDLMKGWKELEFKVVRFSRVNEARELLEGT